MPPPAFPSHRPRRLRNNPVLRHALADATLSPKDLILPLFITTSDKPSPVSTMPGVSQLPVNHAVKLIHSLASKGLKQFLLFGVTPPSKKDPTGSFLASPDAPVNRVLSQIRSSPLCDKVLLYADLCFCEYTDHGHCGALTHPHNPSSSKSPRLFRPHKQPHHPTPDVDNDRTLELLAPAAVALAKAGAHVVAPSGMIDGQVAAIRSALDSAGFQSVVILSYSIKYASSFYSPFRDAGQGAMKFGNRATYQMDFRRSREWKTELQADLDQGADMVMVKPALAYLDVLHQVRQACSVPVAAFHVSGEYAMLHAAAKLGTLDLQAAALESTYAIKRAGADLIITYFAPQLLDWLAET